MADPEYFTLTEFRLLPDMDDATAYPEAAVLAAAAYVTAVIERECGTSFVSRTVTGEEHDGGGYAVVLSRPHVLSVSSATEDGVAVTDDLRVSSGVLRKFSADDFVPIACAAGVGNVSVTYAAGYSTTPPADIKSAAMYGTRARLLEKAASSGMDERRTSLNTDMGVINYTVAGQDNPTGYPQVDAVILGWRNKLNVFGFA